MGTAVLLCRDLASSPASLDARAVVHRLAACEPAAEVHILPDLCARPDQAARYLANGATTLVVGLCRQPPSPAPWHTVMRGAGLDPLGLEIVALGVHAAAADALQAIEKAAVLLAAAVARVKAFPGSRPQHLRPVLPSILSRRSIFTLSLLEYRTVPSVAAGPCRAAEGCALCVPACPHQALQVIDGEVRMEKPRCTSCGVCVTACPHDAMEFPGYTAAEMDARAGALLDRSISPLHPRAILFVCSGNTTLHALADRAQVIPASWLPLEVPCVEMVSAGWLLACLAGGATAVGVLPCRNDCRTGQPGRIEGRVAFCRQLLTRVGEREARILVLPAESEALVQTLDQPLPHPRAAREALPGSFGVGAAAQVLQELAHAYGAADVAVPHTFSPLGVLDVGDGCTICGACAAVCPTDALTLQHEDGEEMLIFDPAECVACGQCLPTCPEPDTLHLRQGVDLGRLAAGRAELRRSHQRRCTACGAPIAPEAMLQRIAALLGGQHARTLDVISHYCQDCRAGAQT